MCNRPALCYTDGGAGLSDRIALFTKVLQWVAVLNASFQPDPPCTLLTPKHNKGVSIPCGTEWNTYISMPPHLLSKGCPCSLNFTSFYTIDNHISVGKMAPRVVIGPSSAAKSGAAAVVASLGLENARFDFLHIRRTDGSASCNTSLPLMVSRLERRSFGSNVVLYATDEPAHEYNSKILATIKGRGMRAHLVENELRTMHASDNYMAYAILLHLKNMAAKVHQWRRHISCPD